MNKIFDVISIDKNGVIVNHLRDSGTQEHVSAGQVYVVTHGQTKTELNFQEGSFSKYGVNGLTNESLLEVVKHRIKKLNEKFSCPENGIALDSIETAIKILESRANNRIQRGIEGENIL